MAHVSSYGLHHSQRQASFEDEGSNFYQYILREWNDFYYNTISI